MLEDEEKTKLVNRLRRLEGQIRAIQKMVESDAYCVDTLTQISAAVGAMNKVGAIVLENHLRTCVAEAMNSGGKEKDEKLAELIDVFRKYSRN